MKRFFLIALFLLSPLFALEDKSPWLRSLLHFDFFSEAAYSYYSNVQSPNSTFRRPSHNVFLHGGVGAGVWPAWDVETSLHFAKTRANPFAFESFFFDLRHSWFDDIQGDFLTFTGGVSLAVPASRFKRDLSVVFHGDVNALFHLSVGKEFCPPFILSWRTRLWGFAGFGIANQGAPWLQAQSGADWRFHPSYSVHALVDFLYGFGSQNLSPEGAFDGYRSIGHQSIDIAFLLTHTGFACIELSLKYQTRLHARNFPENEHLFALLLSVPIGF